MTTDLDRLIEAVEAGEGNRNDGTLYRLFGDSWVHAWDVIDRGSLDAAVALLEALLPGWAIERMTSWPGRCCRVSLWGTHDLGGERWHSCEDGRIDAEGPTLARALLLATLRAYRCTREGG